MKPADQLAELAGKIRDQKRQSGILRKEIAKLNRKLLTVREDERRRIAQDLHDEIGQQLTALSLNAEIIKQHCTHGEGVIEDFKIMTTLLEEINCSLDFLVWHIRPADLERNGLAGAVDRYVQDWSHHCGVEADLWADDLFKTGGAIARDVEITLYRIAQEALNNVAKHAKASNVELLLKRLNKDIVMIIEDNGIGFEAANVRPNRDRAAGIVGMKERAQLVGGVLDLTAIPGPGTSINVCVPLRKPKSDKAAGSSQLVA